MLTAERTSVWRNHYDITTDSRRVARWQPSLWKSGGEFELDGRRYQIRRHTMGSRYELTGPDGEPLATAQRVGRKRWTVQAGEYTYQFRRASIWRGDQELLLGDQAVGTIHRTRTWRSSAVADLPGMPEPIQVFVLCVVLAMWDATAAAAGAGGAYSA